MAAIICLIVVQCLFALIPGIMIHLIASDREIPKPIKALFLVATTSIFLGFVDGIIKTIKEAC